MEISNGFYQLLGADKVIIVVAVELPIAHHKSCFTEITMAKCRYYSQVRKCVRDFLRKKCRAAVRAGLD